MDYGMYTAKGNEAIHRIVEDAKENKLKWRTVYNTLTSLAKSREYAECLDTDVREQVYCAIGAGKRDESFWV